MTENIRKIKVWDDDKSVFFGTGKKDDWCVYYQDGNFCTAFSDVYYFTLFKQLAVTYGNELVYNDFWGIYENTSKEIDKRVLDRIEALDYFRYDISTIRKNDSSSAMEIGVGALFTIIYAGMVAEENVEHYKLKSRIKNLAMFQVLIQNFSPVDAANFSKTRSWRENEIYCDAAEMYWKTYLLKKQSLRDEAH